MTVYERLREKWESAGIALAKPVDASQLADFERQHQVKLPQDLREYLVTLGGMAAGEMDEASLSLHGFAEMFQASDAMAIFPPPDKTAVVADFLIDSHLYVTPLDPSGAPRPVYLASHEEGGWRTWPIADTFGDFLAQYLADAESIAFPPAAWSNTAERFLRASG